MDATLTALFPVFLVISLGYVLRLINFTSEEAWRLVERLVYYVLFPALILHTLALADLERLQALPMASALLASLIVMALVLTVSRRTIGARIGMTGPAYSSIFQGSLRWNSFVALAAVAALYGSPGITAAALAIAVMVPTVNVLSVLTLSRHASAERPTVQTILMNLVRNPLILACAGGILLNLTGIGLPGAIAPTADLLGRAALTLGLLSVGAGLDLHAAVRAKGLVLYSCLLKLILVPILVATFCAALSVTGLSREVAILCGAVPTASSSYVLARQLGGDHALMAAIITATTLGALFTMPLMLGLLT